MGWLLEHSDSNVDSDSEYSDDSYVDMEPFSDMYSLSDFSDEVDLLSSLMSSVTLQKRNVD